MLTTRRAAAGGALLAACVLAGCGVSQKELDSAIRDVDMRMQRVESAQRDVEKRQQADVTAIRTISRELRALLEEQSRLLGEQKKIVDAVLERLKAADAAKQ